MRLRRYRPIAIVLLAVQLQGCLTWRPIRLSPGNVIEEERPERVRVTLPGEEPFMLQDPRVVNDTLVVIDPCGRPTLIDGTSHCAADTTRVAGLADAELLEIQRTSLSRSVAAGAGAALALLLGAYVIECSGSGNFC